MLRTQLLSAAAGIVLATSAMADGIVGQIVNAPLSATGTVHDARTAIDVYLQSDKAQGIEFMDPKVPGYAIPPGGTMQIIMGGGFERLWDIALDKTTIMLVTGAPQQDLPGMAVGYEVIQGEDENTYVIKPAKDTGLPVSKLISPAKGARRDQVRNRGIKVIHIGFMQSAFVNQGATGTVTVRILDGEDQVVAEGRNVIEFLPRAVPQILPTNLPQQQRNHNWQRIKPGQTLGVEKGTVPLTLMLYAAADTDDRDGMYAFKTGLEGVGVLSTRQLNAMDFPLPEALARYTGGLIVQETSGDGILNPRDDRIIGGVIGQAPEGATGQELKSPLKDGVPVLSVATATASPKAGRRWGGALMELHFTAGSKPGIYRPTLALMRDPTHPEKGDGSSFTYTVVVE